MKLRLLKTLQITPPRSGLVQPAATAQRLDGVRLEFRVASSAWLTTDRYADKMKLSFSVANNWPDHPELKKPVSWATADGNDGICFEATEKKKEWMIRMNDFPDEPAYTLIIDNKEIIHFDDWPNHWIRPEFPEMNWSTNK